MSRKRNITSEQILYALIQLRENENKRNSLIKKEVNREKCKSLGLFPYVVKKSGEVKVARLFLISEIHDGYMYDLYYNEDGDVIAYNDYSEKNEIQIAKEIELDKKKLERQIALNEEQEDENNDANNDTAKAGGGRDLASKEHEEENKKDNKDKKEEKQEVKKEESGKLRNLRNDISMEYRTRIRLDTVINGHCLWEILGIEETMKNKMPNGVSEKAFRGGWLTRIDSKELNEIEAARGEKVKTRKAEDTFAIVSPNGDIVELDEDVIEPQYLGTRDERLLQEQNRERWADGEHTFKPQTDMTLTRTSKWRIKNVDSKFAVNEEWFLGVDYNEDYVRNGTQTSDKRYLKEISIVQAPKYNERVYNRDSAEARTIPTIEYKLEDITEAPLNEKEQKQNKQLEKSDANEALNLRKEHQSELENLVNTLTEKYGEGYREEIKQKVDEEHKKGNDVEEIEKNVKEEMNEMENELYRYGRRREI